MKCLKVAIIDDNNSDLNELEEIIKRISLENNYRVDVSKYNSLVDLSHRTLSKYHIIFIDIFYENSKVTGIEYCKEYSLRYPSSFICYISAFPNMMQEAFIGRESFFITKPFVIGQIEDVFDTYFEGLYYSNKMIEINRNIYFYAYDILKIEAENHKVKIYYYENNKIKTMMIPKTLKEIKELLPIAYFTQINRFVVINLIYVKERNNEYIILNDNNEYKISSTFLEEFNGEIALYYLHGKRFITC